MSKKNQRIHPVEGYSNSENMWEKLWNLDKPDQPPNKYPNFRSEFIISANNKQFKVKKNPLYKKVLKEMMGGNQKDNQDKGNSNLQDSNNDY